VNTGELKTLTVDGQQFRSNLEYLYYKAAPGDNHGPENRASGTYVFRPDGNTPINIKPEHKPTYFQGKSIFKSLKVNLNTVNSFVRI
jgi:hypothetical protein